MDIDMEKAWEEVSQKALWSYRDMFRIGWEAAMKHRNEKDKAEKNKREGGLCACSLNPLTLGDPGSITMEA